MSKIEELKQIVGEKALLRGDFVLSSGARSTFYIDLRRVSLSSEGVFLIAELVLDTLENGPPVEMIGGPTIG